MKHIWLRFIASLTPGVRILLALLTVFYLAALSGRLTHAFDLYDWLSLSGPQVWHGELWRLFTYALLPLGVLDFAMNAIALVMLGGLLERHWSRGELWVYCLVVVMGSGLVKILLQSSIPLPLTGATPMLFGLIIAWGFLNGREIVVLPPFGEVTVWKFVCIAAIVSVLLTLITDGASRCFIMTGGGLAGWMYLWLQLKWLMHRPGKVVHSERMNRLEL